jgi:hypothetical protein
MLKKMGGRAVFLLGPTPYISGSEPIIGVLSGSEHISHEINYNLKNIVYSPDIPGSTKYFI